MNAQEGTGALQVGGRAFPVTVQELPARRFAVRRHHGDESQVDETRRPLYQHLILHELVGGPPVQRFPASDDTIDVLVGTVGGFDGDDQVTVEVVPAGWFATVHFEGPEDDLPAARASLRDWARLQGHDPGRPVYQVHLMDPIDEEAEQELQYPLSDRRSDRVRDAD